MYRTLGQEVLSKYINNTNNVQKIEKKVNNVTNNQEEYKLLILEVVNNRRNGNSCKIVMEKLKLGDYLDNRKEYVEYREKIEEHDGFLVKPFEVDEGY